MRIGVWVPNGNQFFLHRLNSKNGTIGDYTGLNITFEPINKETVLYIAYNPSNIIIKKRKINLFNFGINYTATDFFEEIYNIWNQKF